MKKILALIAIAAFMTACNNSSSEKNETNDSTATAPADTTVTNMADTASKMINKAADKINKANDKMKSAAKTEDSLKKK